MVSICSHTIPNQRVLTAWHLPLARLWKLRNLRLTHPLFHPIDADGNLDSEDETILRFQTRYQQLANEILRYLVEHGSSVELLAFGAGYYPLVDLKDAEDINGHVSPKYKYVRGTATVPLLRGRQRTEVTAVPVPLGSLGDDMNTSVHFRITCSFTELSKLSASV